MLDVGSTVPADAHLRALDISEMRARQLRILDTVIEHCHERNLTVYLCAGTLLGAIRHSGYIPWDDDIDIMLPRAAYEQLCATFAATGSDKGLSLRSLQTHDDYPLPFAKVCDDSTVLDVESDVVRNIGVYIDVFPIDGWLPAGRSRRVQRAGLTTLQKMFKVKHLAMQRSRGWYKQGTLAAAKALLAVLPARVIARAMTWVARRGDYSLCDDGGVIVWGYRETIPRSSYGEPETVSFEGRQMPAPHDADDVLRRIYGRYMELPPEHQRVTHHRFTAYARD
jgi:lipopolysaccharide cholinephosphotransferase